MTMTVYQEIIAEATGETDPKMLENIEDIMRNVVFCSTLDWQTREQLSAAAIEALEVIRFAGEFTDTIVTV